MSLRPYKLGLSKVVKLKTICCALFKQKIYFVSFHFYKIHVFKGQNPLEEEEVKLGTTKHGKILVNWLLAISERV